MLHYEFNHSNYISLDTNIFFSLKFSGLFIDLTKLEVLKLSIAMDELNIQSLIHRIDEYLIYHQHEFLQQNPVGILETIYQNESFRNFMEFLS